MSSNSQVPSRRGRPRSENARRAILGAAAELALEGDFGAGIDAIAARAGVSRTTVYKWWPSAAAVLLDGLLERTHDSIESPASATTREALEGYLQRLIVLMRETATGALLRGLVAASVADPSVARALIDDWLAPRRAAVVALLTEGERRGEIRPGLNSDAVGDVLFAPIYYRLMFAHAALEDELACDILALAWPGISTEESADRPNTE